jgi:hypothetical protein
MHPNLTLNTHQADLCVVGGGMAGLIAAVAAARRGANVVLIHDRPVLGGNASSEVRMWICGAHGHHRKETGILEEIQLANLARNPEGLYSVWDSVLFEFATMTPGLTTLLNCSVNNAAMRDSHLAAVDAWQLTTQTWHRVEAGLFIDCSGDSILAPLSGADTRTGRESREEFGESIAPKRGDLKTMGNTILLQLEETNRPQNFRPPRWAYRFDERSPLPSRVSNGFGHNFWWLELGGLQNTISDAEAIRDELVKTAWGVWDYMKNHGPQAELLRNWRLHWLGALPGKRENRRYLGDHILTQNDLEAEGRFDDVVAYGGWSMDDHHPAGLHYPGAPTIFHKAPSPYGIPFRSLYSRNVPNLLFAGRNISATHCALSSTRVMATCALLGQAVGTAAALCCERSLLPREILGNHLRTLQERLQDDDCWLPGIARPMNPLTLEATISGEGDLAVLLSGYERETDKSTQHWEGRPGDPITLTWPAPRHVECVRLIFDSDLNNPKMMPCRYPLAGENHALPASLVKAFTIECQTGSGEWETLHREEENTRRLSVHPVQRSIRALRWTAQSTWGDPTVKLFSLEATAKPLPLISQPAEGMNWNEVTAMLDPSDLAAPDHGLKAVRKGSSRIGA